MMKTWRDDTQFVERTGLDIDGDRTICLRCWKCSLL